MRRAETNLDRFWVAIDSVHERETGMAHHPIIRKCLDESGELHRTAPWVERIVVRAAPTKKEIEYNYQPLSRMVHDKTLEITGAFDKMSMEEKAKTKPRGTANPIEAAAEHLAVQPADTPSVEAMQPFTVDARTHKVFKTLFYTPTSETGDLPKASKWVEFKRAMGRVGFSVEKLQGSARQFVPGEASHAAERNIQFHEPHPDSDIPYVMANCFGRRLGRVYGWSSSTFKLA
jgi:hypothetical protein